MLQSTLVYEKERESVIVTMGRERSIFPAYKGRCKFPTKIPNTIRVCDTFVSTRGSSSEEFSYYART